MSRISCVRSTTRASRASSSVALLDGVELVVDEQDVCARLLERRLQLRQLALADVRSRIGALPLLDELADRLDPGGPRQLAQLAELVLGVGPLRQHREHEAALGLRARVRIGLAGRHRDG